MLSCRHYNLCQKCFQEHDLNVCHTFVYKITCKQRYNTHLIFLVIENPLSSKHWDWAMGAVLSYLQWDLCQKCSRGLVRYKINFLHWMEADLVLPHVARYLLLKHGWFVNLAVQIFKYKKILIIVKKLVKA